MGWSQDVASIASPLGPSRTPIPKMACTWVASRPFPAHRLLKSPDLLLEKHEDRRRWNHVWGNRRPEVHDMFWLSPSANIQSSSTLPIVSTQPVHICLVVSLGCFFSIRLQNPFFGGAVQMTYSESQKRSCSEFPLWKHWETVETQAVQILFTQRWPFRWCHQQGGCPSLEASMRWAPWKGPPDGPWVNGEVTGWTEVRIQNCPTSETGTLEPLESNQALVNPPCSMGRSPINRNKS